MRLKSIFKKTTIIFVIASVLFFYFFPLFKNYKADAVVSFVRTATGVTGGNGDVTVSATFSAAPSAGNLLVAIIGANGNVTINTPSGWSTAINESEAPGQAIFYKIAGASESSTITVTVSALTHLGLQIYEYNGIDKIFIFDGAGSSTGNGTSVSSGNVSTTKADTLLIAGIVGNYKNASFSGWTNSFIERNDFYSTTGTGSARSTFTGADRIVSATGSYSTTAVISNSCDWRGQIAAFKIAPVFEQASYRWFANADSADVEVPLSVQNIAGSVGISGDKARLRMLLHVGDGELISSGENFKLQFVGKGTGTCVSPSGGTPAAYTDVVQGSGIMRFYDNPAPVDGAALVSNVNDPIHSGHAVISQTYEEANNFINSQGAIQKGQDGLWDFSLINNSGAVGSAYCFRAVKSDGSLLSTYTNYPELLVENKIPTATNVILNSSNNISLVENSTVLINLTGIVSDDNGYGDLNGASSQGVIYRSGVGNNCSADDNNCYIVSPCVLSGCFGTSCIATCSINIQFFSDPTDIGVFSAEQWQGKISISDNGGANGSGISSGVELDTLYALGVAGPINYGSLEPVSDTGAVNQTTTVMNTGNSAIDILVSGLDMSFGINTITADNQKYGTSTFTYSSCPACANLQYAPALFDINLSKPVSTVPVTKNIFWGLAVPVNKPTGSYSGTNTFTATANQ